MNQIGVPGIVAILLLREVFGFLKSRQNGKNGPAGEKSIEYWQQQFQGIMSEALKASVIPILASQTAILSELRIQQQRLVELLLERRAI